MIVMLMLIVVLGLVPVSSMYSTWSDKFSYLALQKSSQR